MKLQGKSQEELEDIQDKIFSDLSAIEVGSSEWQKYLNTFTKQFVWSNFRHKEAFTCLKKMAAISNKLILINCYGDGESETIYASEMKTHEELDELIELTKKLKKYKIIKCKKIIYLKDFKNGLKAFDSLVIEP